MKRRRFFKSLAAIAGIAFAEPLALFKREPKWILEAQFGSYYVDAPPVYDKAILDESTVIMVGSSHGYLLYSKDFKPLIFKREPR